MRNRLRALKWWLVTRRFRPPQNCFPPDLVHTNDPWTRANWAHLYRGVEGEAEIRRAIEKVRPYTMVTHDGLLTTYRIASYAAGMNGCFVETGVHHGGSAAIMAMAATQAGVTPHLHLFDSFQGLPHVRREDYDAWMSSAWGIKEDEVDGALVSSGALMADKALAEKAVFEAAGYPRDKVTFHVGWFQETVPGADTGPIAVLRLDGDLYESTWVCLRHFYPKVIKGGFVIIDDFGLKGCRTACQEYFREIGINPFLNYIDTLGRYFVKD